MKIALLDLKTLSDNDMPIERFAEFGELFCSNTLYGEELKRFIKDKDIVLCNRSILSYEILSSCKNLKLICLFATGFNNVDLDFCNEHNITVCNVPGYSTEAVVQQAVCFLLMLAGNTEKYSAFVKAGRWSFTSGESYFPYKIMRLKGKTIGLFGMGNMGKRMAEICTVFGMNVIYNCRNKKDVPYRYVDKETLFKLSDFISFHCPVNSDSEKLLNKETIVLCKDGVNIINTARGGLIDEEALFEALVSGKVAGAAADVVTNEPLDDKSPLFKAPNMIFTPHTGWADYETRTELFERVYENIKNFIEGHPTNVVNKKE